MKFLRGETPSVASFRREGAAWTHERQTTDWSAVDLMRPLLLSAAAPAHSPVAAHLSLEERSTDAAQTDFNAFGSSLGAVSEAISP